MTDQAIDVVGIGNAIVDVISQADDGFLEDQGLAKGAMTLIDAQRAEQLYTQMGPGVEMSGGGEAPTQTPTRHGAGGLQDLLVS